jgi:hypothetical protein
MAGLSRVSPRPIDDDSGSRDLADPGYLAMLPPAPAVFQIEIFPATSDAARPRRK